MAARVWRHLGPGSGGSRERVSLSATDCYIVHEIYSGENAQDQFEYELEQALEVKYKYIVEHTQIGDETAHWITVSNYLHKTAVLAGTACLFTTLALPLDYPHYISLAAGVLSLACCMLYGVSGSLTLAASTRWTPLQSTKSTTSPPNSEKKASICPEEEASPGPERNKWHNSAKDPEGCPSQT
ncbi:transmembrane protein 11 [Cricetulus griseus]|uniref:Transmembrane protein 11 n=1 Tax=Cricetulus griseus TaxID=10029 RepID=A0A061I3L9_CRIGR|nr:transmembrane protein 11 [Cricetulus griseus]